MTRTVCTACRTAPRSMAAHLSTRQHRRAVWGPVSRRPAALRTGRPGWAIALDADPYAVSEEEERAAAIRLGLTDWSPA